jgi:hypothetical protein
MDINKQFTKILEKLRTTTKDWTAEELYKAASNEHLWALGSSTDAQSTNHEQRGGVTNDRLL